MKHVRGVNKGARRNVAAAPSSEAASDRDVEGRAPVPIGCVTVFNPGWETDCAQLESLGSCGSSFHGDIPDCHNTCYWPAQVPDDSLFPSWLNDCGNVHEDWQKLCFVPD